MYGKTALPAHNEPVWSDAQYEDWAHQWSSLSHNVRFQYTLNDSHPSSSNFVSRDYPPRAEHAPYNETGCEDGYYRWWTASNLPNPHPKGLTCVLSTDLTVSANEQLALCLLQEALYVILQVVPVYLSLHERKFKEALGAKPTRVRYWSQAILGQVQLPTVFGNRCFEEVCAVYDTVLRPAPNHRVTYVQQGQQLVSQHPRRKRPLLKVHHPEALTLYTELGLRFWQLARDLRLREERLLAYALG